MTFSVRSKVTDLSLNVSLTVAVALCPACITLGIWPTLNTRLPPALPPAIRVRMVEMSATSIVPSPFTSYLRSEPEPAISVSTDEMSATSMLPSSFTSPLVASLSTDGEK